MMSTGGESWNRQCLCIYRSTVWQLNELKGFLFIKFNVRCSCAAVSRWMRHRNGIRNAHGMRTHCECNYMRRRRHATQRPHSFPFDRKRKREWKKGWNSNGKYCISFRWWCRLSRSSVTYRVSNEQTHRMKIKWKLLILIGQFLHSIRASNYSNCAKYINAAHESVIQIAALRSWRLSADDTSIVLVQLFANCLTQTLTDSTEVWFGN